MIDHKIEFVIDHKIDFVVDHKIKFVIDHKINSEFTEVQQSMPLQEVPASFLSRPLVGIKMLWE